MSTYVLVHGAWHGGWAWDRLRPLLEARGHRVLAPTLAGLGSRAHELDPQIGLRRHAVEVALLLEQVDADPLIVVAHSYGALVAREAVDRARVSVARVVLIDGWAGGHGSSMFDLAPSWFTDAMRASAARDGEGWRIPPPPAALFGVTAGPDVAWLEPRLTAQPLRTFEEATTLSGSVDQVPGTAIMCSPGNGIAFDEFARTIGYEPLLFESGHDAMVTKPRELAAVLAGLG